MFLSLFTIILLLSHFTAVAAPCTIPGNMTYAGNIMYYCDGSVLRSMQSMQGAACTTSGQAVYANGAFQFCDGSNYWFMQGALLGTCSGPSKQQFDTSISKMKYCDGSLSWDMTSIPQLTSTAPFNVSWNVISRWNGTAGAALGATDVNNYTGSSASPTSVSVTATGSPTYVASGMQRLNYNGSKAQGVKFTNPSNAAGTQYLSYPTGSIGFMTGDFTIAFWLYRTSTSEMTVASNRDVCAPDIFWRIKLKGGPIEFEWGSTGNNNGTNYGSPDRYYSSTSNVPTNQWAHIAIVRSTVSSTTTTTTYINGTASGSLSGAAGGYNFPVGKTSTATKIATGPCTGVDGSSGLTGSVAQFAIWNQALSAANVANLYAGQM